MAKLLSARRRLAGANLIGFDTSVWKDLRSVKDRKAGRQSKVLAAKAGVKVAWRK